MGYWEIELSGRWKSIGKKLGQACNDAKGQSRTQVVYTARGQQYVIDFPTMTQTNTRSGKARYIREKGAEIHVYPSTHPAAGPEPADSAPEEKGGGGSSIAGKVVKTGALVGVAGAAAVGVGLLAGAFDIGDITEAAEGIGDAIGDIDLDEVGDALQEAAGVAADAAGDAAKAAADAAAAAADAAKDVPLDLA